MQTPRGNGTFSVVRPMAPWSTWRFFGFAARLIAYLDTTWNQDKVGFYSVLMGFYSDSMGY